MNKDDFDARLFKASDQTVDFAKIFVSDELPSEYLYFIGEFHVQTVMREYGAVVQSLWHNGSVPRWVDMQVHSVRVGKTCFQLRHGSEFFPFTEIAQRGETEPFRVRGPLMPRDWKRGDERFVLNWRNIA